MTYPISSTLSLQASSIIHRVAWVRIWAMTTFYYCRAIELQP